MILPKNVRLCSGVRKTLKTAGKNRRFFCKKGRASLCKGAQRLLPKSGCFFRGICYNIRMILTDMHTHSTFSNDGRSSLADMAEKAKTSGFRFLGVSEHLDTDSVSGKIFTMTDVPAYFSAARRLQEEIGGEDLTLLAGGEYGYSPEPGAQDELSAISARFCPDFVVNSVHIVDGHDCYFADYFEGKEKKTAYAAYLARVRESLDAPYYYDIVGHLGYVSRNAPYEDRKIRYRDFPDLYDEILKAIIAKGKILEVNSASRGAGSDFLPDTDVLERYFALGGRLVTFGSDAHETARIGDKRELVIAALKKIGFTFLAVPVRGRIVSCKI